ncbi:MAG: class I SAM-dependent methyltransferase [Desulfurococcales archaeon]|nr:class I SAM-dependent methyltransferase [Desulfurococcales archaeon]
MILLVTNIVYTFNITSILRPRIQEGIVMRRILGSILVSKTLRLYHRVFYFTRRSVVFKGVYLYLSPPVFIPKFTVSPGLLVDTVRMIGVKGRVLDYGCGSGAISLAMASIPGVREVICYDISGKSLRTALMNAVANRLNNKVKVSRRIRGLFDAVVSNPPYLPLDPKDPLERNWCSSSSLEVIRGLFLTAKRLLERGGLLIIAYSSLTGVKEVERIAFLSGFKKIHSISRTLLLDRVYVSVYKKF